MPAASSKIVRRSIGLASSIASTFQEQLADVTQPGAPPVDDILARSIAEEPPLDLHNVRVNRQPAPPPRARCPLDHNPIRPIIPRRPSISRLGLPGVSRTRRIRRTIRHRRISNHWVVERQRDARHPHRLPRRGTGENHVDHLVTTQALAGSLAEYPLHGINDVALAAPIGTDHARHGLVEHKLGAICK
jgi:hypothetical protein